MFPYNTPRRHSQKRKKKKKEKKGWRVKFRARNKFTGKVVVVKVKERNGSRMRGRRATACQEPLDERTSPRLNNAPLGSLLCNGVGS